MDKKLLEAVNESLFSTQDDDGQGNPTGLTDAVLRAARALEAKNEADEQAVRFLGEHLHRLTVEVQGLRAEVAARP